MPLVEQVLGAVALGVAAVAYHYGAFEVLVGGTLLYAVFTFPSFPIIMGIIGNRVGKDYDMIATGNVFVMAQLVTALVVAGSGLLIDDRDWGANTTSTMVVLVGLPVALMLNVSLIAMAMRAQHTKMSLRK